MHVGTERRPARRARLRKYVVTEDVEQTVPVQRETARVEREPITDDNVEAAMGGPEITESEHEVALHEEEPVVEKRTVPKERARLEKDTATEERTVGGEVRKERIEPEETLSKALQHIEDAGRSDSEPEASRGARLWPERSRRHAGGRSSSDPRTATPPSAGCDRGGCARSGAASCAWSPCC
jgi:hypothetical protein